MPYIFLQGNLTLASIEFHSHTYVSVPHRRADVNVASFNDRVQVMINNCIRVCVSLKNLSEGKNSRSLHIKIVLSYYSRTFHKRPPKMSRVGGRSQEVAAYESLDHIESKFYLRH